MKVQFHIALFLFIQSSLLQARPDTLSLPTIEISAAGLELVDHGKKIGAEKNWVQAPWTNLAALNSVQPFLFINQNSLRGLASPNFRGLGFERTQITWNGLSINSPANGGIDYQLIDRQAGEQINFYSGGHAALAGSGAMGGTITLREDWLANKNKIALGINQFGDFSQMLKWNWKKKNYRGNIKYSGAQGAKTYKYRESQQQKTRNNVQAQSYHLLQNNFWKLNKHQFSTHLWWNHTERQIPANSLATYVGDTQFDDNFRAVFNHQYNSRRSIFKNTLGLLRERIFYTNNLIETTPVVVYRAQLTSSQHKELGENWRQIILLQTDMDWSSSYQNKVTNYTTLSAAYTLSKTWGQHKAVVSARQSFRFPGDSPFTGFIKYRWVAKKLKLSFKASRDYRQPTLNDLFWRGPTESGNLDLKSESSWGQEANIQLKFIEQRNQKLIWDNTLFSMQVTDWIQWQFNTLWTPENLKNVWTRGVTSAMSYERKVQKVNLKLAAQYTFNPVSEKRTGTFLEDQLIRTPLHQGQASLELRSSRWSFTYLHQFNGQRNLTNDNSSIAKSFTLGNANLAFFPNEHWSLGLHISNTWNQFYAFLPFQPMPGRTFQLNAAFSF